MFQDQIDVDDVCKTAILNVMSHRRVSHQQGRQPDRDAGKEEVSFRVWDLCLLERQSGIKLPYTTDLSYKPRSAPVVALEKAYDLVYDDFTTQKLHPRFFEKYPFLYCESAVSKFHAQDLRAVVTEDVGYPQELSQSSVDRLRELILIRVGFDVA